MYYKFEISGLYCGTSETEVAYSTSVAPPDESVTPKWVWNHVNWVCLPLDGEGVQGTYNAHPVVTPVVEDPTGPQATS